MRIIFAGTPEFAIPSLKVLHEAGLDIVAVYTQPDRPVGRGRRLRQSPVKEFALEHQLPIRQPESLKTEHPRIDVLMPALIIVVAYGLIVPAEILNIPEYGCVNIHASLLPRWRGAAPIQRAIEAGDKTTGVTLMQMDAGLDSGDILAQSAESIQAQDTAQSLHDRLAVLGAGLLKLKLQDIVSGSIVPLPQNSDLATYANKLEKNQGEIDWEQKAVDIVNRVRAFNPWPVAYTHYQGSIIRIWEASSSDTITDKAPGTVVSIDAGAIQVSSGQGIVEIVKLQRPGSRVVTAVEFINGRQIQISELFS